MNAFILCFLALCLFFQQRSSNIVQATLYPTSPPPKTTLLKTLTIYATGNTNGYLEPCPCSKELLGGVAVRAGVFQPIRQFQRKAHLDSLGRYYLIVDAGNRLSPHRHSMKEALLLFSLYNELNYDALNLGWQDLRFGVALFKDQKKLPFIASNVFDAKGKAFVPRYRVVRRGGKRIAIFGVLSQESFMLLDSLQRRQYQWVPEDSALASLFKELKAESFDVAILLSNSYDTNSENNLLDSFSQFRGIVTTSEVLIKEEGELLRVGKTDEEKFIISTGHDGEFVSAVTLSEQKSDYQSDIQNLRVEAIFPILLKPYLPKDKEILRSVKAIQKKFGLP